MMAELKFKIPAFLIGGVLAAAAVAEALRQGRPLLLLGLIPAATLATAILIFGMRRWPKWSKVTAGCFVLAGSAAFLTAWAWLLGHPESDWIGPVAAGLGSSLGIAALFLAGGWVYRDAQRRGLNACCWAAISVLVFPYLLGLIAYLALVVLRDQRLAVCPACAAQLPPGAAFCICCGRQAGAACAACRAPAVAGAAYCPRCGAALAGT